MSHREKLLRYFTEQKEENERLTADGIEQYRKGDALLEIESDGATDITVHIRQKTHAFRFGANLFMLDEFESDEKNRIYREKFPELFNLATLPFYWSDLEPTEGHPRFAKDSPRVYRRPAPDLCLEYCEANGIEPKCHCLNYDAFTPDWVVPKSIPETKAALEKRFSEIAARYADRIPSLEVTNETLQFKHKSAFFCEDDFVEWSFATADRYFPKNRLIINDYNVWNPSGMHTRNYYYMQIERLLRSVPHLDSIGLQFHSLFSPEEEEKIAGERYNPQKLRTLMNLLARLGKAEQITEMTIPARSTAPEDEQLQADLLTNIYRVFFSHPAMEAILYWNLVDGYAAFAEPNNMSQGENVYYGGLLRSDMSEKPAYKALRKLIHEEWNTSETVCTRGGVIPFRGFYGDYEIEVCRNDRKSILPFSLRRGAENHIRISL